MTGMSPSIPEALTVLPVPPAPTLTISGTQSGSIQLLAFSILVSSFWRLLSARFFARTYSAWSSRRISPSPGPFFADPGVGAGMGYFVPRMRYWKFGLRWTWRTGASPAAFGADTVAVARRSEGLPHEGQNCLE